MIVAVPVVCVVQVAPDDVVRVVAVRHGLVAAVLAVRVARVVVAARVTGGAARRIGAADVEAVAVDVIAVHVVHVTVVEVVGVTLVLDRGVAAIRSVDVGMVGVRLVVVAHGLPILTNEEGKGFPLRKMA